MKRFACVHNVKINVNINLPTILICPELPFKLLNNGFRRKDLSSLFSNVYRWKSKYLALLQLSTKRISASADGGPMHDWNFEYGKSCWKGKSLLYLVTLITLNYLDSPKFLEPLNRNNSILVKVIYLQWIISNLFSRISAKD